VVRHDKLGFVRAMTRSYNGSLWLFPAAGTAGGSLHPLMSWWAVLYTLPMLARYQPS
jgi:YaaC-like Protein